MVIGGVGLEITTSVFVVCISKLDKNGDVVYNGGRRVIFRSPVVAG